MKKLRGSSSAPIVSSRYDNLANVSARMYRSSSGSPEGYQLILAGTEEPFYCSDTVSSAGPSTTCMFQTVPLSIICSHNVRTSMCTYVIHGGRACVCALYVF